MRTWAWYRLARELLEDPAPDGTHLDVRDASAFSRALARILAELERMASKLPRWALTISAPHLPSALLPSPRASRMFEPPRETSEEKRWGFFETSITSS